MLLLLRLTYALLLLIGLANQFWLGPPDAPWMAAVIMGVGLYLPLLLMMPAVINADKRGLTWLCFLLLFYFCGYVIQVLDPEPVRTLAIVKVSLTTVLFVLSMQVIRGGRADR